MKYVTRLQAELAAAEDENRAMRDAVAEFRCHLAGPKFSGTEQDGGRKDWIAVADVNAWLARILQAGAQPVPRLDFGEPPRQDDPDSLAQ